MKQSTINRLKSNPHFKPSRGLQELMGTDKPEQDKEEEVRTYGVPETHPTGFQRHPTGPRTIPNKKR